MGVIIRQGVRWNVTDEHDNGKCLTVNHADELGGETLYAKDEDGAIVIFNALETHGFE